MKKLYQKLHAVKGTGFLISKYVIEDGTLLRGAVFVLKHQQIVSVVHANDGGWIDDNGKVRWFDVEGNNLFLGQVALKLNVMKNSKIKSEENGGNENG